MDSDSTNVSPERRGQDKSAHTRERQREEENTQSLDQMWMFIDMNELRGTVAQLSNATCDICHKLFCSSFPISENTLVIVV